jgi:hypothetical protein
LFLNSGGEFGEPEDPDFAHCARAEGISTREPSAGEGEEVRNRNWMRYAASSFGLLTVSGLWYLVKAMAGA